LHIRDIRSFTDWVLGPDRRNLQIGTAVGAVCPELRRNITARRKETGHFWTVIFRQAEMFRLIGLTSHLKQQSHVYCGREGGRRRISRWAPATPNHLGSCLSRAGPLGSHLSTLTVSFGLVSISGVYRAPILTIDAKIDTLTPERGGAKGINSTLFS